MTKFEIDGKIFDDEAEALAYCESQGISGANITIVEGEKPEEQGMQETPESPSDEGITERERQGAIILEHYDEIKDETLKGMVLSTALGQETGHNKVFGEKRTSENAIRLQYEKLVEDLQDEKFVSCPLCNILWSKLAVEENMKENLNKLLKGSEDWAKGMMKSPKQLKKGVPVGIIRQIHLKSKHPNIFKTLQKAGLSQIPKKNGKTHTDNPESCSKPEELSADQSGINDNKRFLEQLSKKAKEGIDLTSAERKRLLTLWKGSKETS